MNEKACSLAISKSYQMQLNVFEKSIRTLPTKRLSLRAFFSESELTWQGHVYSNNFVKIQQIYIVLIKKMVCESIE